MVLLGGVIGVIGQNNLAVAFIAGLLLFIGFIIFQIAYIRFIFRLYIVELPLAIENNLDALSAIGRSWKLTKGFFLRLILIVTVAYLILIPLSILVQIVTSILEIVLTAVFPTDSPILLFVYLFVYFLGFLAGIALLIPFWQTIKAVIYYDLRSRKEGLDLQMHDSPSQIEL
jgi:hypothetical protein